MSGVSGAANFYEFAEDIGDFQDEIPQILDTAVENTGKELRREITRRIEKASTSKGGTFDSETSEYEPGGTNDSSSDNLHISDVEAWNLQKLETTGSTRLYSLTPREAVEDRAKYINFGTDPHSPDGNDPYYFQYGGVTIVVSDVPPTGRDGEQNLAQQFEGEPQEVSGVDELNYYGEALAEIRGRGVMKTELRKAFNKAVQKHLA